MKSFRGKIEKENRQKLQNWEYVVSMKEREIKSAQYMIAKEQIQKHKLLNHENETILQDAERRYKEYVESDEKARKTRWLYGNL